MEIAFYVFSGTGNTLRVCRTMADELEKSGNETEIHRIKGKTEYSPSGCIVIGYPVHAFNAPLPVLKYLKSLPRGENTPVYIIQTSGEPLGFNRAACISPIRILRKKGYDVRGTFSYVMPYNIIFRHSDAMAARMWNVVRMRIPCDSQVIASLGKHFWKTGIPEKAVSFILRIEHPATPLIGRGFKVSNQCTGCGKCAAKCPVGNIVMRNGRPHFGSECCLCMGCAFSCPSDAVRTSLLNAWRVNGQYDFTAECAGNDDIGRYCRSSYLSYFHRYEDSSKAKA